MKFAKHLLMDQATETNGGGADGTKTSTPPTQTQETGDTAILQQMYGDAKTPTEEQPKPETTKDEKGKTGYEEVVVPPVSGYEDPTKTTETKVEDPAKSKETTETKVEVNVEGLSEDSAKLVKDFAATHKLSKEAADAFASVLKTQTGLVEQFKSQQAQMVEKARSEQKINWYNELKGDKDFGGENFNTNLKRVDTILEKFLPNTKNLLTSRKSMLPPSIMKDLHGLHKVLLGSDPMVNGDSPSVQNNDDINFLNNFYK